MAGRVNKKFVFGLSAVLVLLMVGLIGFYFVFVAEDPQQLILEGDQYLAQGDTQLAVENYGRALRSRPTDVPLIGKYVDALRQRNTDTVTDARNYLGQIQEWSRRATELDPGNAQLYERFYGFMLEMAQKLSGAGGYNQLYQVTAAKLENDPDNLPARKYRGIAQVHRRGSGLSDQDWNQALQDLLTVYQQHPDDALVAHNIALWQLQEADRVAGQGGAANQQDAQKLRQDAVALSAKSLQSAPDNPRRIVDHLQILTNPQVDQVDKARPLLARVEKQLLKDPRPAEVVTDVVQLLPRVDHTPATVPGSDRQTSEGIQRAAALLQAAAKADPDNISYHLILGNIQKQQGRSDQAIEQFRLARSRDVESGPVQSLRDNRIQGQASYELGSLLLGQADQAKGEPRDQLIDQTRQIIKTLAADQGDSALVYMLRGKLALVQNKPDQATVYLDKASSQYGDRNPELLLLSARARQATQEWGAAADRLQTLLQMRPGLTKVRLQLAQIYLRNQQLDAAARQIQAVTAQDPDNARARELNANLLIQQNKLPQAIAAYQQMGPDNNPRVSNTLAALYARNDQPDKARALLNQRLADNPQDLSALQLLLSLTDDPAQGQALLDHAQKAGVNPQAIKLLRMKFTGDTDPQAQQQMIQDLLDQQPDPLKRALVRARMNRRQGKLDQARAAVDEAAQIDPDNPDVVELQFDLALQANDLDRAETLADRAGRLNLDLANGSIYQARLDAAGGDLPAAIASLRQGLQARPVYSPGWRMLGELLMRHNETEPAIDAYKRALDQKPNDTAALRGLAQAYDADNQPAQALQTLQQARRYAPDDDQTRNALLNYQSQHGDPEQALAKWRQAARDHPDQPALQRGVVLQLLRMDRHDQALEQARRLADRDDPEPSDIALLARVQLADGHPDRGLKTIQDYLDRKGDQATATDYLLLARYDLANNNAQDALVAYQQGIDLEDPKARPVSRELADLLFQRGQNDQALAIYQDLHRADPDDDRVSLRLAETMIRLERFDDAQTLLADLPDGATRDMLRVAIARHNGDTEQAQRILNRAIAEDDSNPMLLLQRARIRLADDPASARAVRDLNQVLSINPDFAQARLLLAQTLRAQGQTPDAIRELNTLLTRQPDNAQARVALLGLYQQTQDVDAARDLAQAGAERFPQSPLWPQTLGQIAQSQGRDQDAVTQWRKAVQLAPSPQNLGQLGLALLRTDQPGGVVDLYRDHAQAVSGQPILQAIRARALVARGDTDAGLRVFSLALKQVRNGAQARNVLSQATAVLPVDQALGLLPEPDGQARDGWMQLAAAGALLQAGQPEPAEQRAAAAIQALPQQDPPQDMVEAWRLRATANYQLKRFEQSRDAYQQLLKYAPNNASALNNLAYMLAADLNQPEAGLKYARQAADAAPNSVQILDTLGFCQIANGNNDDARQTLQRSVQQQVLPSNSYHLALAYHRLGDALQARQWVQRALDAARRAKDQDFMQKAQQLQQQL